MACQAEGYEGPPLSWQAQAQQCEDRWLSKRILEALRSDELSNVDRWLNRSQAGGSQAQQAQRQGRTGTVEDRLRSKKSVMKDPP